MKRNLFSFKTILGMIVAMVALAGCASSSHDDHELILDPAELPTVSTGEYGLVAKEVRDYFAAAVTGTDATYTTTGELPLDQIEGASEYVWKIWKASVERNSSERLPVLFSHYQLSAWDDITTPDASWKLPERRKTGFGLPAIPIPPRFGIGRTGGVDSLSLLGRNIQGRRNRLFSSQKPTGWNRMSLVSAIAPAEMGTDAASDPRCR